MIITIDGPAGTGKSTVARLLAEKLGFTFFDTGAMYRAVTYKLLKEGISFSDRQRIEKMLKIFSFRITSKGGEKKYFIGTEEVTHEIRTQEVTLHVSEVAALPFVRAFLSTLQRRFAENTHAVFEGRDLGTVIFPEAQLKIFLTARPEIRAERRFRELLFKHPSEAENLTKQQVLEDLLRRDTYDTQREHSPLMPAKEAHTVDTSDLSVEQVVDHILKLFHEQL